MSLLSGLVCFIGPPFASIESLLPRVRDAYAVLSHGAGMCGIPESARASVRVCTQHALTCHEQIGTLVYIHECMYVRESEGESARTCTMHACAYMHTRMCGM